MTINCDCTKNDGGYPFYFKRATQFQINFHLFERKWRGQTVSYQQFISEIIPTVSDGKGEIATDRREAYEAGTPPIKI